MKTDERMASQATPPGSGAAADRAERGEALVALLKDPRDYEILTEEGWYRIPVGKERRRWPPKWLAFYLPKAFAERAFAVRYYGRVRDEIEIVPRRVLFPGGHSGTPRVLRTTRWPSPTTGAARRRIPLRARLESPRG